MAGRHDGSSALSARASRAAPELGAVDVLSDVLRTVRLTGALFFPMQVSSPWIDAVPNAREIASILLPGAQHVVSYHIIRQGQCWAALRGEPAVRLQAGDVFVVPHGDPYMMASAPDMRPTGPPEAVLDFFREMATGSAPLEVIEGGGGPERAQVVCGFLGCDLRPFNPVIEALPRVLYLRTTSRRPLNDRVSQLVDLALAESRERQSGARCVLLHLSELLFVEVVRRCLESTSTEQGGWLAGLRDPVAGHALALLHNRPADPWSLERLAREIGASRSLLAERFSELVGQPPMRYLARWRVQLACRQLREGGAKVSTVAFDVGYHSEAAFSRAFKTVVGTSPATWRQQQKTFATAGAASRQTRRKRNRGLA